MIKKAIIALAIFNVLVLGMILFFPYKLERTYLSTDHIKKFYLDDEKAWIKNLVLGDSTMAFGVRANFIPYTYSLALPSSTNINIWLELERYLEKNQSPRCIIYSTSYIDIHYDLGFFGKHTSAQLYSWRELSEAFEEIKKIEPNSSGIKYYAQMFYLKYFDFTSYSLIKLRSLLMPFGEDVKEFNQGIEKIHSEKGYVHARKSQDDFFGERQKYLIEPFNENKLDDYFFQKILKRSSDLGSIFVFVEMPIFNKSSNPLVTNFHQKHMEHIKSMLEKYQKTYLVTPSYVQKEEEFFDANHLNSRGSIAFSHALRESLPSECLK